MMEIFLLIVLIALLIFVIVDVKITKSELRDLKRNLGVAPPPTQQYPTQPQPVQPQQSTQQQPTQPQPTMQPQPALQPAQYQPVQPQPAPQTQLPMQQPTQPQPAPPIDQTPVYPMAMAYPAPVLQQPIIQTAQVPPFAQTAPQSKRSWESWIGRNVIGIIASVLVFLGLIFLGILVLPYVGDIIKITFMFALSAVLSVAGFVLVKKKHNNFTVAVLGTGCGAFFISILVTHIFFNVIAEIPALILLLVWLAASLFVAKITQSVVVSFLAHLGAIVAIWYGFVLGLTDQNLIFLLCYQLATIAVIVGGNILCSRKTYRLGLFTSLVLILAVSLTMWDSFADFGIGKNTDLPPALIITAFLVQLVLASVLSYLLFRSTLQLKSKGAQVVTHIFNKLLWLLVLFIIVPQLGDEIFYLSGARLSSTVTYYYPFACGFIPTFIILLGHIGITVLLQQRLKFSRVLELISVITMAVMASFVLFVNCALLSGNKVVNLPATTYFVILALVFLVLFLISKQRIYQLLALIWVLGDLFVLIIYGFAQFTGSATIAGSLIYLAVCLALVVVLYLKLPVERRQELSNTMRLVCLFVAEIGLISIFMGSNLEYRISIMLLCCLVLLVAAHYSRFENKAVNRSLVTTALRINEFVVIYASAYSIAFTAKTLVNPFIIGRSYSLYNHVLGDVINILLYLALAAICMYLLVARFIETVHAEKRSNTMDLLSAIGFTLLVLAVINGNTSWFNEAYTLSLVVMITALAMVLLGFWSRIKVLRLYGLVVMIVSIIKLVTLDIMGIDSVMRVVAFIGGGLICFAISALYNFAVKRLK